MTWWKNVYSSSRVTRQCLRHSSSIRRPWALLEPVQAQEHPQVQARQMVREVEYPLGKTIPSVAIAMRFRKHPTEVRRAPLVGEHNAEIVREYLQLADEEIDVCTSAAHCLKTR